ncbi:hypothetical protein ABVT39_016245, partial [Epinephelus coioides]
QHSYRQQTLTCDQQLRPQQTQEKEHGEESSCPSSAAHPSSFSAAHTEINRLLQLLSLLQLRIKEKCVFPCIYLRVRSVQHEGGDAVRAPEIRSTTPAPCDDASPPCGVLQRPGYSRSSRCAAAAAPGEAEVSIGLRDDRERVTRHYTLSFANYMFEGQTIGHIVLYVVGSVTMVIAILGAYGADKENQVALIVLESVMEGKWRSLLPLDQASDDIKNQADALQTS